MACRFRHLLLLTSALLPLGIAPALAGPDGANVVGGAATIQGQGSANVTITQGSNRAIINWTHFNIGAGERTQFVQPDSSSVALNRVTGGLGPTEILGTLSANGRVFVINRDGILFGPNAKVDTAGFLATTSDIKNSDFMAGRYNFNIPGRPDASIINQGTITAHSAGFAALVAPGVRNTGTITATLGTVGLAAGNSFTLDFYGDKLISLAVGDAIGATVRDVQTGRPLNSLVENAGRLQANGGRVELTAAAARQVVDSVINNRGVIEANTIGRHRGTIVLGAATAASRPADAPRQTVRVSGTLSASASSGGRQTRSGAPRERQGGRVIVTGENIEVAGARIDVSAPAGGGTVLIGGDWGGGRPDTSLISHPRAQLENSAIATAATVTIDSSTVIDASARDRGNAGKVVVWADGNTAFSGSIIATGGAQGGDGGFVEVSGRQHLDYLGTVDLRAPVGAVGTLLLDPLNFYINATGVAPANDPGASAMAASQIESQLATANVVIATAAAGSQAGDISVEQSIRWGTNSGLTLSAFHDIIVAAGVTIANTNQASGTLVLRADNSGTGVGTVKFLEPFNPGPEPNPRPPITGDGGGGCEFQCIDGPRGGGNGQNGGGGSLGATAPAIDFSQSQGHVAIFYNPTSYTSPTNYSANVAGQLTSFMLVNNATNLSNIATNPSATYALGRNIDASAFTGMPVGTMFTGVLDGNGGLGVNSSISNLGAPLFPTIGAGTSVRNVTLTNVNISATADNQIIGALARENFGHVENSSASGVINGGAFTGLVIGGLIGQNFGSIAHSGASVNINVGNTSAAGQFNFAGGLVGNNLGEIIESSASGRVAAGAAAADLDFNTLGGLVANNFGTITNSQSSGPVSIGAFGVAGGFVGTNAGTITRSTSSGAVTGGDESFVGGFAGWNIGGISESSAAGAVNAGSTSFVGGFAALNVVGTITASSATGPVTAGDTSVAGGLAGVNLGSIATSFATGAVVAGTDSHVGGLVGINIGLPPDIAAMFPTIPIGVISQSFAAGAVTGGANSNVGGLVGGNGGAIDQTYAVGAVTGGAGSRLGGLVAVSDATFTLPSDLPIPGGPQQGNGTVTNSYWDRQTTGQNDSAGGTPLTTAQLSAALPAGFDASVWGINVGQSYPFLQSQPAIPIPPLPPGPPPPGPPDPPIVIPEPPIVIPQPPLLPLLPNTASSQILQVMDLIRPADWNPVVPPPVFTQAIAQTTQIAQLRSTTQSRQSSTQPGGNGPLRPDGRPSNVPPPGETRFISDQVVVQISVSPAVLDRQIRRLGLTVISSQSIGLLGTRVIQFRITSGRSVREVIIELEKNRLIDEAAPNYEFELAQAAPAPAGAAAPAGAGDPAQYMVSKLRLAEAHRLAKGDNVRVAVIDSEIDAKHPDIEGAIQARYEGAGPIDKAHPHGTGMAGAIASHRKLMGVAPGARILAVRAFGGPGGGAQGTTVQIVQGLDWAVGQGARIVNMSFAGPKDPTLQKAFKAAFDKGIVLIAAAGNAGPKSPPLYPGADPNVIAVSATDADDKVYANANRGKYIAVSAPGVDILVPAPDGNYEFTTGTSVAAAHVSGVAALLLQRDPKLDPAGVREILTSSANALGARGRNDELGYGLVDPYRALQAVGGAKSSSVPAPGTVAAVGRTQ